MSVFQFQQFSVIQQHAGMKICTDSVLFGAMAPVSQGIHVLDIGTGTGVLALMLAQLGATTVTGVELTFEAYHEARLNFSNSSWSPRLEAVHQDIKKFALVAKRQYELIICNPPFFENHSKSVNELRKTARHTDRLAFGDLIAIVERLLSPQGLFYLLIATHSVAKFNALASTAGLYLIHQADFRGYAHNEVKVSALTFSRKAAGFTRKLLTIYDAPGVYSQDSEQYLKVFLLRFANKNKY